MARSTGKESCAGDRQERTAWPLVWEMATEVNRVNWIRKGLEIKTEGSKFDVVWPLWQLRVF